MESRGDLALYEYLYRCIRHDIAHGKVEPGQKLPSKRALAKQLGVSLITIEAAYDQLHPLARALRLLRMRPRARRQDRGAGKRSVPNRDRNERKPQTRGSCLKPERSAAYFAK